MLMDAPPGSRPDRRALPRRHRLAARPRPQRARDLRRRPRRSASSCSRTSATTCSPSLPAPEPTLYAAAIDLIADLQSAPPPPATPGLRAAALRPRRPAARDAARSGVVPARRHRRPDAARPRGGVRRADRADHRHRPRRVRRSPVYRDYHAENLIWLPERDRAGPRRPARLPGPADRPSGLRRRLAARGRPARRARPTSRAAMLDRYLARSGRDREAFLRAAHALVGPAQPQDPRPVRPARAARRQAAVPAPLPRVWAHLRRDLAHPDLASLAAWVDRASARRRPRCATAGAAS